MTTVGDIRDAMKGLKRDAKVMILSEGYRVRDWLDCDGVKVMRDDRKYDDWGNEKEPLGKVLVLESGGWGDNRYPPSDDDDEEDYYG